MNLLIITQKVDVKDTVLGFFQRWINEFAKHYEKVTVICLQKGEYNLPENVKVLSLGKEDLLTRKWYWCRVCRLVIYVYKAQKYLWQERKNYDVAFIHMNPELVLIAGPLLKILRKKMFLWYTHKAVNFKLWIAEKFVDKVFTASKKSFRLKSKKAYVTGHGIDLSSFQSLRPELQTSDKIKVITVGRISPAKNLDVLIEAAQILKDRGADFSVEIVGVPLHKRDELFFNKIKNLVEEKDLKDHVNFVGSILHKNIQEFYKKGGLFVNLSNTGSIDKAILEAMASGLNVLTSNEAFRDILPAKNFTEKDPNIIAEKIIELSKTEPSSKLREYVAVHHSLGELIKKIAIELNG